MHANIRSKSQCKKNSDRKPSNEQNSTVEINKDKSRGTFFVRTGMFIKDAQKS